MSDLFGEIGDNQLDEETRSKLKQVTDGFFERPMEKAEDFDWESFRTNETFKAIMMPSKLFWVLTHFERSFTQKLGQEMYEKFGKALANSNQNVGEAETSHLVEDAEVTRREERKIESIITALDEGEREPNWEKEKQEVLNTEEGGAKVSVRTNWDLWIKDFEDGKPLAAEIKTPKPNKDQTMEAKRKMLKTIAAYKHKDSMTPIVRYVFPFNPYGSLENYNHWAAKKIFDVENSDGMMISEGFWDAIGGEGSMEGLFNFLLEESTGNIEKLQEIVDNSQKDSKSNLSLFSSE